MLKLQIAVLGALVVILCLQFTPSAASPFTGSRCSLDYCIRYCPYGYAHGIDTYGCNSCCLSYYGRNGYYNGNGYYYGNGKGYYYGNGKGYYNGNGKGYYYGNGKGYYYGKGNGYYYGSRVRGNGRRYGYPKPYGR